jgi:hypothetical protein
MRTAGWMTAIGFALALPAAAKACPVQMNQAFVEDVPANGTVLIDIQCDGASCLEGELPADLGVVDLTAGGDVAGTITSVSIDLDDGDMRIAWRPQAPLVAGHVYELGWQPKLREPMRDFEPSFEALPSAQWKVEAIELNSALRVQSAGKRVTLEVEVDAIGSPELYDQYAMRAAFWSSVEEPPVLSSVHERSAFREFEARTAAYCYRVELRSLIDDATQTHEACMSVAPPR